MKKLRLSRDALQNATVDECILHIKTSSQFIGLYKYLSRIVVMIQHFVGFVIAAFNHQKWGKRLLHSNFSSVSRFRGTAY